MFPKDVKPNFINASWIHSEIKGKPRMIATQGPVPESVGHFWRMELVPMGPFEILFGHASVAVNSRKLSIK